MATKYGLRILASVFFLCALCRADVQLQCRGDSGTDEASDDFGIHIGTDSHNERISDRTLKAGFTRTISRNSRSYFWMVTQYGVNHPFVNAFEVREKEPGKIEILSPREDGNPHSLTASAGTYRFEVHPGFYVECNVSFR